MIHLISASAAFQKLFQERQSTEPSTVTRSPLKETADKFLRFSETAVVDIQMPSRLHQGSYSSSWRPPSVSAPQSGWEMAFQALATLPVLPLLILFAPIACTGESGIEDGSGSSTSSGDDTGITGLPTGTGQGDSTSSSGSGETVGSSTMMGGTEPFSTSNSGSSSGESDSSSEGSSTGGINSESSSAEETEGTGSTGETGQFPICGDGKLIADDGAPHDRFGSSVAVSRNSIGQDFIVVGAPYHGDGWRGAVYVYSCENPMEAWTPMQKLLASNGDASDRLGSAVAIDGNVILAGAPYANDTLGIAYVFEHDGNQWVETAKLQDQAGQFFDYFGHSVSIYHNVAVVGASQSGGQGAVFVFEKSMDNQWILTTKLVAGDGSPGDSFGFEVSIHGNSILAGAPYKDDQGHWSGAAYLFERNAQNEWFEKEKFLASDGDEDDMFGYSVSNGFGAAVVGAPYADGKQIKSGAVFLFEQQDDDTFLEHKLVTQSSQSYDDLGVSVAVYGAKIAAGAWDDDDQGENSGAASLFKNDGNQWQEAIKLLASDGGVGDLLGKSVAVNGKITVVGAHYQDNENGNSAGAAYVFND